MRLLMIVLLGGGLFMADIAQAKVHTIGEFFNSVTKDNMTPVDEFYAADVEFSDPAVALHGREAVKTYYKNQYENVISIRFAMQNEIRQGDLATATWKMHLAHKALNSGKEFTVDGVSVVRFDPKTNQAIYHRDYFDMGEFVYERVPVLGSVLRFVKGKIQQQAHEN